MAKKHSKSSKSASKKSDEYQDIKQADAFEKKEQSILQETWKIISSPVFLITILILIPLFLSVWFRAYPSYLPITDNFAHDSIVSNIKGQISSQVNKQYPLLPSSEKQKLVDEQLSKAVNDNKAAIDKQVLTLSKLYKSKMQKDDNQTYLIAIDPYQHLRRTKNLVEKGYTGDLLINGESYNNHQLAPLVLPVGKSFQIIAGYIWHKIYSIFKGPVDIMNSFFWLPVLFSALAVIPAFFLGRKKGGYLGGFISALIIAVHAGFIGRTSAGFADTDPYVILFPLFMVWFIMESLSAKELKPQLIWASLAGITSTIFLYAWQAWFMIFLVVAFYIGYIGYLFVRSYLLKKDWKESFDFKRGLYSFGSYFITYGLFTIIFLSFGRFISFITMPLTRIFSLKSAVNLTSIWPNVFTTVAELNSASIGSIVSQTGASGILSKLFFLFSLIGLIVVLMPKKMILKDWYLLGGATLIDLFLVSSKAMSLSIITYIILILIPLVVAYLFYWKDKREFDFKYAILIAIWFVGAMYAMTQGIRFVLLLIPPFAISLGFFLGRLQESLSELISKEFELSKTLISIVLFIIVVSLFLPTTVAAGKDQAYHEIPSMNDAWWNSLTKIKEESAPNAIINSWWDFGHWFKYIADRGVTFDGASQNTPNAHWIGEVLLTDNETTALANLRMLDCGNYKGEEDIEAAGLGQYESIMLMKNIIKMNKTAANSKLLEAGLTQEQSNIVLNHTHCKPPEDYFITSQDMVGKAGVWGHFGSWSFEKADALKNFKKLPSNEAISKMQEKYSWTEDKATNIYYEMQALSGSKATNNWISPWPGYISQSWKGCTTAENNITTCGLNIVLNNKQGAQTVLEGLVYNESSKELSLSIAHYVNGQKNSNSVLVKPEKYVLAFSDDYEEYTPENAELNNMGVLLDVSENRVLITDPSLLLSTFTKLFYLDGRYMPHFEKFSDETSFRGEKIVIWKVKWPDEYMN